MDITTRALALIEEILRGEAKATKLEEATGISKKKWQNLLKGIQKVTSEMVEALSKAWPEYAFWLATGISDSAYGHLAPEESYVGTNVERYNKESRDVSRLYFSKKLLAQTVADDDGMARQARELGERVRAIVSWNHLPTHEDENGMPVYDPKADENGPDRVRYLEWIVATNGGDEYDDEYLRFELSRMRLEKITDDQKMNDHLWANELIKKLKKSPLLNEKLKRHDD